MILLCWYRILGRELFSFSTLKVSFHCLALFSLRSHLSVSLLKVVCFLALFQDPFKICLLIVGDLHFNSDVSRFGFLFFLLRIELGFKFIY